MMVINQPSHMAALSMKENFYKDEPKPRVLGHVESQWKRGKVMSLSRESSGDMKT